MKVAVIGGAGYIGAHVVLALTEAGHEPVVFDDLSTGWRENISCPLFIGDILNETMLDAFFTEHKPHAVMHLAGKKAAGESMRDPALYAQTNISGTINVLGAMLRHGCDSMVFSSSAAVYGTPQYLPMDERHSTGPENFYGYTKLVIEGLLTWYGQTAGLKSACLRYFNAAGYDARGRITKPERGSQNLLPILLEAASGTRPRVDIFGDDYATDDGTCVRDYVHVSDLARAHVAALEHITRDGTSFVLNLGTGKGHSVRECVEAAQKLYGTFAVDVATRRPGDPPVLIADSALAKKMLAWEPQYRDIAQILRTMGPLYGLKEKR